MPSDPAILAVLATDSYVGLTSKLNDSHAEPCSGAAHSSDRRPSVIRSKLLLRHMAPNASETSVTSIVSTFGL